MLARSKEKILARELGFPGSVAGPETVLPLAGCPSKGPLLLTAALVDSNSLELLSAQN